jgi:prepilin-type N-terminal cleavage/methylation domain-containing protein
MDSSVTGASIQVLEDLLQVIRSLALFAFVPVGGMVGWLCFCTRTQGHTPPRRREGGFTLIELLVVIAVIAILAALLFPVFAQAREKGRQAACLSNLKQMGMAVALYAEDHDEKYPLGSLLMVPGPEGRWDHMPTKCCGDIAGLSVAARLLPYTRSTQVFLDPSDPGGDRMTGYWDAKIGRVSYWFTGGLGSGVSWATFPRGRAIYPNTPLRLADVERPALLQITIDMYP